MTAHSTVDVDVASIAQLIADPSRAAMLDALLAGPALSAGELASRARVSPQTASTHLARLVAGGLLVSTPRGRQRYYQLAGPAVAHALEALAVLAPAVPVRSLRQSLVAEHLRFARSCYDHLAGKLGVELTETLLRAGTLVEGPHGYDITEAGARALAAFGLDLAALRQRRRAFARPCLDWSERRPHLAGSLGAALLERCFALGWLERVPASRALRLTECGRAGLRAAFGLSLPAAS